MKELIKVIAFDADDTLWSNEPFFQEVEKQYTDLLKPYGTPKEISAALFQTEMNNLKYLGYGAKAFTISMVETALHVSGQKISGTDIQHIIELGKSLLKMPIELLPGVKETLKVLKEKGIICKSWDTAPRRLPFQWSKQHYRSATERLQLTLFGKLSI